MAPPKKATLLSHAKHKSKIYQFDLSQHGPDVHIPVNRGSWFEPNSEDELQSLTGAESRYMDGISDKEDSDTSVLSDEDGELHCSADIKKAMA